MPEKKGVFSDDRKEFSVTLINENHRMGSEAVPFYGEDYIPVIVRNILALVKRGLTCNLMVTGHTRSGKSTLAIRIAKMVSDTLSLEDIVYWPDDYQKRIREHPYADYEKGIIPQVIWDEAVLGLMSRRWYEEQNLAIIEANTVFAKKGIVQYFVIPHRMRLDRAIREDLVQMWLHTTVRNLKRGYAESRRPTDNPYDEDLVWRGDAAFKFSQVRGEFWEAYESKKIEMINTVLEGKHRKTKELSPRAKAHIQQRDILIRMIYDISKKNKLGITQRDIGERIDVDHTVISDILSIPDSY